MSKVQKEKEQFHLQIKEATYEVIKTALKIGILESSNFIKFYGNCAKFIRDSDNPEEAVRNSALKIFPIGLTWDYKITEITNKYKTSELREKLLILYRLYFKLSQVERERLANKELITDEEVDDLLDRL